MIKNKNWQLFLISLAILYFELICIRWIPAYIRHLGYFTNLILLASFLGIGIGCLNDKKKSDYIFYFPSFLFLLIWVVYKFKIQLTINPGLGVLYFQGVNPSENFFLNKVILEPYFLIPLIFGIIALLFILLSQNLGRLFNEVSPPLKSYSINILGSLAGIFLFFINSYFSFSPLVWFSLFILLVILISPYKKYISLLNYLILLLTLNIVFLLNQNTIWSPYYKITLTKIFSNEKPLGYNISVNETGHQELFYTKFKEAFYFTPYRLFKNKSFKQVLIIGAGGGSDVAIALDNNAQNIDAVEIDPIIAEIGRKFHPEKPYNSNKVNLIINDGRNYIKNTKKKYDLIVFALTDSLTLTSSYGNIRLESFLFTLESFKAAAKLLNKDGLIVLYNYYREKWLIDKLGLMLKKIFKKDSLIAVYDGMQAAIMNGPALDNIIIKQLITSKNKSDKNNLAKISLSTDDWPFLYIKKKSFPKIYIVTILLILSISIFYFILFASKSIFKNIYWDLFFLGAAFMLLETKSIVGFNLIFGSTWMTNSLVFFAILFIVLLAILFNFKYKIKQIWWFYLFLFGILFLNWIIPPEKILLNNFYLNYLISSLLAFSPIFLANIIFANLFKEVRNPNIALGSNILGALCGGLFEYTSVLWGYKNLIIAAALFYFLSLIVLKKKT